MSDQNTLWESLGISWIFYICHVIYSVVFLIVGGDYLASNFDIEAGGTSIGLSEVGVFRTQLITTLFSVLSFPLFAFYVTKIWSYSIRFSSKIFEREDITVEKINAVAVSALSSHSLYLFPFVGGLLKNIWYAYILYQGLTKNLKFTQIQTLFIFALPVAVICFAAMILFGIIYLQLQTLIQLIPGLWAAS